MTSKPQFVGQKVTIGELGRTQSGGTPSSKHPEYFGGSIPWIGTTALNGKLLNKTDATKLITEEAIAKSSTKLVPQHSIMVGIRVGVGKVAINAVPMCTSQDIVSIVGIDENSWNKEYISLALQYKAPLLAAQAQGATITGITSKTLKSIAIPVIPLESQNEIVRQLRKIEWQMDSVREQLVKLDSLVKSRFVEMFGDPCDANGNKAKVKVASICELRIGPFGSALHKNDYISGGHPLINPSHIIGGSIIPDADLTVSDDKYKSLEAYHLLPGDIVLGRRGEIGRCAVVQDKGFLCGTGSMILRPRAGVRSEYLQRVVSFPSFRQALERNAVGVTMKNLNAKIVGAADMYLPSINQQDDFISFTKQVDKSRFVAQQQIEKLQLLYDSLAQEYFGD